MQAFLTKIRRRLRNRPRHSKRTRWEVAEADQGRNEQRLVDELGATVVALSDAELAAMAAKARADVWPQVLEDVGMEWGQSILDQVAAATN